MEGLSSPQQVSFWRIATFRCAAELGHRRGITDIDSAHQSISINADRAAAAAIDINGRPPVFVAADR
jgi:hypothetical protein